MTEKTRRSFLALAAIAPVAVLASGRATASEAQCYDPAALPLSQRSQRRALGFAEQASDAAKRCGLCAFFTAGAGQCGTCALLGGGPVTAASGCPSFAAK